MPHLYEIKTGRWFHDGKLLGTGFAGNDPNHNGRHDSGEGLNDPSMVAVKSTGPLPPALYEITPPVNHPTCGAFAMYLKPLQPLVMFGRDGFFIHGGGPGASLGCIVLPRAVREAIWATGDRRLNVVAELEAA